MINLEFGGWVINLESLGDRESAPHGAGGGKEGEIVEQVPHGLTLENCIEQKVSTISDEDRYLFAIRELVQNADDVGARVVAILVGEKELLVVNDGRPFRISEREEEDDFRRLGSVLSHAKRKEGGGQAGYYCSGFHSTYCFTDAPVIVSNGCMMELSIQEKCDVKRLGDRKGTPFDSDAERKGALFRFPWRTREKGPGDGGSGWREGWRWGEEEKLELVRRLMGDGREKSYLHLLLLCLRNVGEIRLVCKLPSKRLGWRVKRDFRLASPEKAPQIRSGSVEEGEIEMPDTTDEFGLLLAEQWKGGRPSSRHDYLIGSAWVTIKPGRTGEWGNPCYFGVEKGGREEKVVEESEELERSVLGNDIHVLLPLSPGEKDKYPRYSVLPLPSPYSENTFACSAHVAVTEDRSQLNLSGERKEWYERALKALVYLYLRVLDKYLENSEERLRREPPKSKDELRELQRRILRVLPLERPGGWLNPRSGEGSYRERNLERDLREEILGTEKEPGSRIVLQPDGTLARPTDCVKVENEEEEKLVRRLGKKTLSDDFEKDEHVERLRAWGDRDMPPPWRTLDSFPELWSSFCRVNGRDGRMELGQKLRDGSTLDEEFVESLIRFCLSAEKAGNAEEIERCAVVPSADGVLRSWKSGGFPGEGEVTAPPTGYEELYDLLPKRAVVHERFRDLVRELRRRELEPQDPEDPPLRAMFAGEALMLLSAAVENQQKRFVPVRRDEDLLKVVRVVVKALQNGADWEKAKEKKAKHGMGENLFFVPYSRGGKAWIGGPNLDEKGEPIKRGEKLKRDHILRTERGVEVPGLTDEIRRGLKMLYLPGATEQEQEKVMEELSFIFPIATGRRGGLVNFARLCLSPKLGSLFEDDELKSFLREAEVEPKPETLQGVKLKMLEAVKEYFDDEKDEDGLRPEDMGEVPCLYDAEGKWRKPKELYKQEVADIVGKSPLHEDFKEWSEKTLKALGMNVGRLSEEEIVRAVEEAVKGGDEGRLGKILSYLLEKYAPAELERLGKRLADSPWVPTQGGLKKPGDSLLPTSENSELLGRDHQAFVKLGIMDPTNVQDKARKLGIRSEPTLKELLERVGHLMEGGKRPPEKLFEKIESVLKRPLESVGSPGSLGYYHGDRWWKSEQIRLDKPPSEIKDFLEESLLILHPEDCTHRNYLKWLGAGKLTVRDVLEVMRTYRGSKDKKTWEKWKEVWKAMGGLEWPHDPRELSQYLKEEIYPCPDGGFRRPDQLLLEGGGLKRGGLGEWYVVPNDGLGVDALKKLGVKSGEGLTTEDILRILRSDFGKDEESAEKLVWLWGRLANQNPPQDCPWEDLSVPLRSEPWVGKGPKRFYVDDYPLAASQFGERVLRDGGEEKLRKLYLNLGAKSLRESVRRRKGGKAERWEEMERKLQGLWKGVHWEVYRMSTVELELELEDKTRTVERGHLLEVVKEGDKTVLRLVVAKFPPEGGWELVGRLSSELYQCLRDAGVAVDKEWDVWKGLELEPPRVVELDVLEGGKGYLEAARKLSEWYSGCQICGRKTPRDEHSGETFEGVKSVITRRGGRYRPRREEPGYDIGNCLYLCPSHHKLFERGLVSLMENPEEHSDPEEMREVLAAAVKKALEERKPSDDSKKEELEKCDCWVFERPPQDGREDLRGDAHWRPATVFFTRTHWEKFLEFFASHWEGFESARGEEE